MTLKSIIYMEAHIAIHICNRPDDLSTWVARFALIVEKRVKMQERGIDNDGVRDMTVVKWMTELIDGWSPNDIDKPEHVFY